MDSVKDVQVQGGNPILSDCAVKAVKQWVFVASEKEREYEISWGLIRIRRGSKTRNLNAEVAETQSTQRRENKKTAHPIEVDGPFCFPNGKLILEEVPEDWL